MTLRLVQEPQANQNSYGNQWEGQMNPEQLALAFQRRTQLHADTDVLYHMFRRAVEAIGGMDQLVELLDFPPSYVSKVSEGMARKEKRRVQLEWLPPLLRHRASAQVILEELCRLANYEMPRPKTLIAPEDLLGSLVGKLNRSGELGRALLEQSARELGTDVTAFKAHTK